MNAKLLLKSLFFKIAFVVLGVTFFESCNKNDTTKNTIFTDNVKEEKEAYFFIATVNVSKKMISKSQIAQQKGSQIKVVELSKKIENQQNKIFQEITKIANKKLIIITEINAAGNQDLYELMNTTQKKFDESYLNSMSDSLTEEIELFRTITKETKDVAILKLINEFLPIQFEHLKEIEELKKKT